MEYEIKPAQRLGLDIKELWDFRELFFFFTWRDIKIKYKQTVLGALWAILQPFLLMLVFTFFFNHALKVPSENIPYPIFVFTGLMLWNVFAGGISNAGNSMVNNANIIKKIYFPRLIIPVSAILASLVDYMMTFIILIGMLIYYHAPIHFSTLIIGLPLSLLITLMTTFGLGSFLSALNVKYRDFRYVIPFLVQFLLFLTPVIYPVSIIPEGWMRETVQILNPMAGAIDTFRAAFSGAGIDYVLAGKSFCVSLLFSVIGMAYFRKTEHYFADLA
ncbi:MAG: ABC transporter permease [Bacteroidetes bacterium]|nr:ABC transporter permease [Bacteroidota bacterium]MBL0064248.1 ABC transporter permease [Bacteroidota bacterium]MBL0139371.1 ABC transporter permease [Bacteroidota bacterium]